MDSETKREIILENYSHPFNKVDNDLVGYIKVNTNNESCIDNIDLYLKFDGDVLIDIKFGGEACAISTASTSIMLKNLIGKNIEEIEEFINNFQNMIDEQDYNEKKLEETIVFDEIYKQANRKTCVILPYIGIKKALTEYKEKFVDK